MIKGTLYEKYTKERDGAEIIESKISFVAYRIIGKECFIVDMFVEQKHRSLGEGRKLIDELTKIAIKQGCDAMTANIYLADQNSNQTLLSALMVGFKVMMANGAVLTIAKKIMEDDRGRRN